MNAVNLIPADRRKRSVSVPVSPLTLGVIGGLVVVLVAAVLYAFAVNNVRSRQSELSRVTANAASWQAAANSYASYVTAAQQQKQQLTDIRQLVTGRFPWSVLLSQIGGVMPNDAALSSLQATAPAAAAASAATAATSASTATTPTAPTTQPIQITGCAASESAVAATMVALGRVQGVSSVALASTTRSATAARSELELRERRLPLPGDLLAVPAPRLAVEHRHGLRRDHSLLDVDDARGHPRRDERDHPGHRERPMNLRKRDRIVLAIVAAAALVGAFYMLALKPERQKASALQTQIATQQQSLASAQQSYNIGRAAQAALKTDGAQWAALKLAVPAQSNIPALLRLLEKSAAADHVAMTSLTLAGSTGASASTASTPATGTAAPSATPVPIQLNFTGGYVALNKLVSKLTGLVAIAHGSVHATGPLLSINSVTLSGSKSLTGNVSATIYQLAGAAGTTTGGQG